VPQAWKVIRTRDTSAISKRMYAITVTGFSLWLAYGLLLGQWPLIVTNGICLALSAFILVMKVLPRPRREAVAIALDPTS
jgi:MtN3 and saliva related transmembrane protein